MTADPAGRFKGKTALVTGAGGGIGSAVSRRLAAEGAHVFVADANGAAAKAVARALTSEGLCADPLVFDLLDPGASAAAVGQMVEVRGRIGVLVNNAGVNRLGDLLALTEDDWDLSLAVNVDSLFHLCRAVLPPMIGAGGGAIPSHRRQARRARQARAGRPERPRRTGQGVG